MIQGIKNNKCVKTWNHDLQQQKKSTKRSLVKDAKQNHIPSKLNDVS